MRIFIFRMAKGNVGGIVKSTCPIDFNEYRKEIRKEVNNTVQGQIPYDTNGYKHYLYDELWNKNKLRQGWGFEGLDLRNGINSWIKHYLIGMRKFWNYSLEEMEEINACEVATGRFDMFEQTMLLMTKGDIIVIPKHSYKISSKNPLHSYDSFTIVTVADDYYFDLNPKYKDFGHVIPVKKHKVFKYGNNFQPEEFAGYYRRAVSEVKKKENNIYSKLKSFIENKYLENNPL